MWPTGTERDLARAVLAGVSRGLWNTEINWGSTSRRVRYVKKGMPRMNTDTVTNEITEDRPSAKSVSEKMAIMLEALKQISELPNNNKLRSFRGNEAVRLAQKALKEVM